MEAVDPFVFRFSIFVLAIFVGYYVVWSVTPATHSVVATAIAMPSMPRRLPVRDVTGLESPRNARMNNTPETR